MVSKLPKVEQLGILVATPLSKASPIHAQTAAYCSYLNKSPVCQWGFVNQTSPELSRNVILEMHYEQEGPWSHVFFIDSDVVPPTDALEKMLDIGADVITGMYPLFKNEGVGTKAEVVWAVSDSPGHWMSAKEPIPASPFQIQACGAGCLLIRREVLDDIGYPWFKTTFQSIRENNGIPIEPSEDVYFCQKAQEKGYKIFAEPSVVCKHYNTVDIGELFRASI